MRLPDGSVRGGVIVDVLGEPAHVHFQVRWSASHESMVFPGEDVVVIPGGDRRDGDGRDGDGRR